MGVGVISLGRQKRQEGFDTMESTIGQCLPDVQQKVIQAASQQAWRDRQAIARSAESQLREDWPLTWAALTSTYFDLAKIGRTYVRPGDPATGAPPVKCNDAGYLVRGLTCYCERACTMYAHLSPGRKVLDAAAAREVRFQWGRQRQARDMRPYLVKCWLSLLVERPERIWPERYR